MTTADGASAPGGGSPGPAHDSAGSRAGSPPVGALADEAAQLLDALAVRLAQVRATVVAHAATSSRDAAAQDAGDPAAHDGAAYNGAAHDGAQHDGADDNGAAHDGAAHGAAAQDAGPHGAAEPPADQVQCVGWCPVCRTADLLRGDRPEVAGKLVDTAIVVVGALRSLLPVAPDAGSPSTGDAGPPPPQPGIERIDIR